MDRKKDVPEYVKESAKYKQAKKEAGAKKWAAVRNSKKFWILSACTLILVVALVMAILAFSGVFAPEKSGTGDKPSQTETGKFEPSSGVPDADIESFIRERYETVAAVTATFDSKVTAFDIKHNIVEEQDLVTVVATVESEICKKTFQLDLVYQVTDGDHWNLEKGEESVVSTEWNEEKLLGWWTGGTTAETLHELCILEIDLENRYAHYINQGREFNNERIQRWNTGEIEIVPSNDSAPYVIDYDGMKWANDSEEEQMMFPFDEETMVH